MTITNGRLLARGMAFFHRDGLPASWKQATKFAGEGGRLATMPDIVAARLETKPGDFPWDTYFTTHSAEYCGRSRTGKRILIVAHGLGPLSTLEGVQKAYSWEYTDRRNRHGGRITQQDFLDLEAGKFGEVAVVDLERYCRRYNFPFSQTLRSSEAMTDPVLKARFGQQTKQYVEAHTAFARMWHREQAGIDPENKYNFTGEEEFLGHRSRQHLRDGTNYSDPYIINLNDASNCRYFFGLHRRHRPLEEGYAVAHLISAGHLSHRHHDGNESLTLEVGCHGWWDGVRMVGIQAGGNSPLSIDQGPDARSLLRKYWCDVIVPVKMPEEFGFRALMQIDRQWFTQYPKIGERVDTMEPEYVVTSIKKVGRPVTFRTTVGGYHGSFSFDITEVQAIAKRRANAYFFLGEPEDEWHGGNPTHQTREVQFYRIEVDTSKCVIRADKLARDYEMIMRLVAKDLAAT